MGRYKFVIETKDADHHRALIVSASNGKLVFAGEWQARAAKAARTCENLITDIYGWGDKSFDETIEYRPYKRGAYPKNSGPK